MFLNDLNMCYLECVVLLFMYVYCCVHKELPLRMIKLSKFNWLLINFFLLAWVGETLMNKRFLYIIDRYYVY